MGKMEQPLFATDRRCVNDEVPALEAESLGDEVIDVGAEFLKEPDVPT